MAHPLCILNAPAPSTSYGAGLFRMLTTVETAYSRAVVAVVVDNGLESLRRSFDCLIHSYIVRELKFTPIIEYCVYV